MNRRLFLASAAGLAQAKPSTPKQSFRLDTGQCDVLVSIEFHDKYSSDGFWFQHVTEGPLCLSLHGERNQNCIASFTGSLAIARYEIRPRDRQYRVSALREYVRTIDRDERLVQRPPFERKLPLEGGVASDIQAFGYERGSGVESASEIYGPVPPWYYFRQDLYLNSDPAPFLIVHWRHAIGAIRMVDMIPGSGTSLSRK